MSAAVPKVHGAILVGALDPVDERPEPGRRRCVRRRPIFVREALARAVAVLDGREHRAEKSTKPSGYWWCGPIACADEVLAGRG